MPSTRTLLLIIAALLGLATLFAAQTCKVGKEKAVLADSLIHLSDSAQTYRNKYGESVAQNRVLTLDLKTLGTVKAGQDKLLESLQRAVKESGKSTTAGLSFSASKTGKASGATVRTVYRDRVVRVSTADTSSKRMPTYVGTASGDGFTASVEAGPDSIKIPSYKVDQSFTATFSTQKKKKGLFSGSQRTVQVTATTPGGKVNDVRSFEVPEEPKRRGLAFGLGYIAGFLSRGFVP